MTVEEHASLAALWRLKKHNCCQGVLLGLADQTGLDEAQLCALGSGFAGGIGGTLDGTCGALIGAVMAAGLRRNGEKTMPDARAVTQKFRERCGALSCRDIKGVDTGTVLCPCEECVKNAVRAYCEVVGLEDA